jgi:hypothetical protein
MSSIRSWKLGPALAALWLACGPTAPPPLPETIAASSPLPEEFSPERAWSHLTALAAIGPRRPGTAGSKRAREYLRGELSEQGLSVEEQRARSEHGEERVETVNVVARIPGDSEDVILLIAPYESPPGDAQGTGVDAGASGAALLLELGRALGARHPAYTIWIAFVEGDALAASGAASRSEVGTGALLGELASQGGTDRIRLAVYFDRVSRPELRIARDLMSFRSAREAFWVEARRLGQVAVFPPNAPFETVDEGHRALLDAGMRRTLAISGSRVAGDGGTSDEAASAPPDDLEHSSRESLASVGHVSLEALSAIAGRLAKIDRFVKSPIQAAGEERRAPAPEAAPAPPDAGEPPAPEAAAPMAPEAAPPREETGAAPTSGGASVETQVDGAR